MNLFSDETAEALADIVLPDASYLERLDPVPNFLRHHHPVGLGDWGHTIRQPAVAALHERRHFCEVIRDLGDRLSLTDVMNLMHNVYFGIEGDYALEPGKQYTGEQIADRVYKSYFGPSRGLGLKLNSTDFLRGGFSQEQSARIFSLAAQLALEELPVESFAAKLGEGVSKRSEPGRILQAALHPA